MTVWREFFILNQTIILFIYGQVFFLLGLAILWQSRRHSRLALARSLGWLGAFGLTHGLHEWGDIFIPIQAEYLNQAWVDVLLLAQLCLLAVSFACLFQFGVETLRPLYPRLSWLQILPAGMLLTWMAAFLWASQVFWVESELLITGANVWARYLLGFTGALVAALALARQTRVQTQVPALPRVTRAFLIASVALVAYAVFSGLIVPPAPFFPADVLNADMFFDLIGIPPQVMRSLAGFVLVIAMVRGLEIFELEVDRRLEEMEQTQMLQAERERVSRELHDGAIQTVYTAGLMVQSIRKKIDSHDPLAPRLDRVISALQHSIRDLRQFISELEPEMESESLVAELQKLANDPRLGALVKVNMTVNCCDNERLSPVRTTHVVAIVHEAFNNVIRHARARHIWAVAERHNGQLEIKIADDGVGMPDKVVAGFGVRNMRDRARLLGGSLRHTARSPRGTEVILSIPWEDPQ